MLSRSSRPKCNKGVHRNFAKFTGKHLWPKACNFIEKETLVISKKFLSTPFFIEHLWWLLLGFSTSQIMLRVFGKDLFDTIKNYFDRYSDDIENL